LEFLDSICSVMDAELDDRGRSGNPVIARACLLGGNWQAARRFSGAVVPPDHVMRA
jgi:hypothetical protein